MKRFFFFIGLTIVAGISISACGTEPETTSEASGAAESPVVTETPDAIETPVVSEVADNSTPIGKTFEGKIVYDIFFTGGSNAESGNYETAGELTYYLKGEKSRLIQPMGGGTEQIVISDHGAKNRNILLNFMGELINITMTEEEFTAMEEGKLVPSVEKTKDKKKIANVSCKKANCVFESEGRTKTIEVYYHPKIANDLHGEFPGLPGFPMEYETVMAGLPMLLVVKTVSEEEVPGAMFEAPSDYRKMTMQEFQKSVSGQ